MQKNPRHRIRVWMPEEKRRVVVSREVKVLESECGKDLNNNNDFNKSSQEDKQSANRNDYLECT